MTDQSSHRRGCYIKTMTARVQLKKTGRESQGAWHQDKLISSKLQVVNLTATWVVK
jgi:hypothetical protein